MHGPSKKLFLSRLIVLDVIFGTPPVAHSFKDIIKIRKWHNRLGHIHSKFGQFWLSFRWVIQAWNAWLSNLTRILKLALWRSISPLKTLQIRWASSRDNHTTDPIYYPVFRSRLSFKLVKLLGVIQKVGLIVTTSQGKYFLPSR